MVVRNRVVALFAAAHYALCVAFVPAAMVDVLQALLSHMARINIIRYILGHPTLKLSITLLCKPYLLQYLHGGVLSRCHLLSTCQGWRLSISVTSAHRIRDSHQKLGSILVLCPQPSFGHWHHARLSRSIACVARCSDNLFRTTLLLKSVMEYLSALQSSPLTSPAKPSLFELLAEQQLSSLLPPTLRYLLALLTHRHPRYLLRVLNSFDEVYALLSLVVEKYYLERFGGSFTENFYGLKREKVLRVKGGEVKRTSLAVPAEVRSRVSLSNSSKDVWKNLAVLVGVPYLKRKLDESYDIHIAPSASLIISGGPRYADRDALPPNPTFRQRVMWWYKWFLRQVYPSINAAYYFSMLAFSMAYILEGTKYSSPFLWLIGTRMRRLGHADYMAFEAASESAAKSAGIDSGLGWRSIFDRRVLYTRMLSSLKILLPTSIFALKFLEWWHASDFSRQLSRKAAEGLELPPPIVSGLSRGRIQDSSVNHPISTSQTKDTTISRKLKPDPPISSTSYLPILTVPPPPTSDLCPICLHPITNPAACQTGYVYDYKCIFQWLEGTHERQIAWMKGEKMSEWEEDDSEDHESAAGNEKEGKGEQKEEKVVSREGKWESGAGRCAITGRRVLGGTAGLRRVMV
jgi:peroxin-12